MTDTIDTPHDNSHGDLDTFLDRYMQMWNEPDATTRRQLVHELWAPDARNATLTMEAVGHEQIVAG